MLVWLCHHLSSPFLLCFPWPFYTFIFTFRSMIHSEFFFNKMEVQVKVIFGFFLHMDVQLFLHHLLKRNPPPLDCLHIAKYQMPALVFIFLFHWPLLFHHYSVLITEALYSKSEKSDTVIPPTLIFLWFLIVLVILVLLLPWKLLKSACLYCLGRRIMLLLGF